MPRKTALSNGSGVVPVTRIDGVQSQSAITAQIVDNAANQNSHEPDDNAATFRQLLDEISANPAAIEKDVQSNYKLVFVVAEAGLDVLGKDDPFAATDDLIAQAIASLQVIHLAIQRSPEVLLYSGPGTDGQGSEMCLWLLPKLVRAVVAQKSFEFRNAVQQSLRSVIEALFRSPETWENAMIMFSFYQACLEDIISGLESVSSTTQAHSSFHVTFPSPQSRSLVDKDTQSAVALRKVSDLKFANFESGLDAALCLLSAITSSKTSLAQRGTRNFQPIERINAWAVKTFDSLWNAFETCSKHSIQSTASHGILAQFLGSLLDFVEAVPRNYRIATHRLGFQILHCITFILGKKPLFENNEELQAVLATGLEALFDLSTRCLPLNKEVSEFLLPLILGMLNDDSHHMLLSLKLQMTLKTASNVFGTDVVYDQSLQESVNGLDIEKRPDSGAGEKFRPSKRQRRDSSPNSDRGLEHGNDLKRELCSLLGKPGKQGFQGLSKTAATAFANLSEKERGRVLDLLTSAPCAGTHDITSMHTPDDDSDVSKRKADICDGESTIAAWEWSDDDWTSLDRILTSLTKTSVLLASKESRVQAMIAAKRLLFHAPRSSMLDLSTSALGKWCLQSLRSSLRELRILAGQTLPVFLRSNPQCPPEIQTSNRVAALDFLKSLSELDDPRYTETTILAFGQMARVCGDVEMNLVLLRLIDFLGDSNPLVCSVAYIELANLAQTTSMSMEELLRPFWRTIGHHVVKDLQSRPQKAQQLSDLLGISVGQLLIQTQSETVPYLVLLKKTDVLQRIATACGDGSTSWSICMQPQNLTPIVSLVLTQRPKDSGDQLFDVLRHVNSKFPREDLQSLLKLNSISIACELLKAAGDAEDAEKIKVIQALHTFTEMVSEHRVQRSQGPSKQSRITADFLEDHALGIMASFSDGIDNVRKFSSTLEKKRCLRGLEEMIKIGNDTISVALPQIRACLQSALDDPHIRDPAFSAWTTLLATLESDDELDGLIDHTFAAIVQNWPSFTVQMQQRAHDSIAALLKNHSSLIRNKITTIPSLASIPLMSKFESELLRVRGQFDLGRRFQAFSHRCQDESSTVCLQALRELLPLLDEHQTIFHQSAISEQPETVIADLVRSLLDVCVKFGSHSDEISDLSVRCLGIIGCLDPNRIETTREDPQIIILSNFDQADEAVEFISFMLENILVKAFHSVTNPRAQSFLAYVMQELLKFCGFSKEVVLAHRPQGDQASETYQRWMSMPERVRTTITPLLTSRYVLTTQNQRSGGSQVYPIFSPSMNHASWLRDFVSDLLCKAKGDNAQMIFTVLGRIVRSNDLSIASFLLPFAATNVIVGGTETEMRDVLYEFLTVLKTPATGITNTELESLKLCSQNIFQCLDYLSRWVQMKKKEISAILQNSAKSGKGLSEFEETNIMEQVRSIERVTSSIPAEVIASRAVECKSYARALFHWEQYIRQQKQKHSGRNQSTALEPLYQRLQDIYSEIDEPDGIEGIAAQLQILDPGQQVLEHEKAGRWSAAQTWYELRLKDEPQNENIQAGLLACLKNSGQYDMALIQASAFGQEAFKSSRILNIVTEAAWACERWEELQKIFGADRIPASTNYNTSVGAIILALKDRRQQQASALLKEARASIAKTLSASTTASIQSCHDQLLKMHALYELEIIGNINCPDNFTHNPVQPLLQTRLEVLGAFLPEKQYLLGIRRAAMQFSELKFDEADMASSWLSSARLARKGNSTQVAYNAILKASKLGDESAKIEHARLLWKEGQHRKAIQSLEGAIATNAFKANNVIVPDESGTYPAAAQDVSQNLLTARAHLLLAKWLDTAGQTESNIINEKYRVATNSFARWEKGQYYLGRYYNKLLESEKALPASKQSYPYLVGETAKLVVEVYLRSLSFGSKYLFQTLPKLLTLWLDLGDSVDKPISQEIDEDIRKQVTENRPKMLETMNRQVKKYLEKIPLYIFYTALAQMITRITHPNQKVYAVLESIIVKVVAGFPQQSLWSLLAVVKSSNKGRAHRGINLLKKLQEKGKSLRYEGLSVELRTLINQGQKLSDQLLLACEVEIEGRPTTVSLARDLGFSSKVAPCPLAIPLEKTLSASLPTSTASTDPIQNIKSHRAFPLPRDTITISGISDDVLVLNSLQRPRKITVRGSDGNRYGLLCKPKDDLRKDQRLMEFNAMINRALKKDAEASKRRLYVKTYAVTPLNEECGLIEWVDGLAPLRDILINIYRPKGIKLDFALLRSLLDEACSSPKNHHIFTDRILPLYPPVLHEYFAEHFPEPANWFAARLRYTRSCAVASMLGWVLGLGDRHGENVLLEQESGGVFHVDFNCLFEKGLNFEKPELVPFRLTHNMVDACGAYGVEGPWRRCAELAFRAMRATDDALLTILETFVYDPTADFVVRADDKARKKRAFKVPDTPREVLESVRGKVGGLLRGESVPLSVEGVVDALIRQATDPGNLASMYIGWCAFL